ncbi:protein of unknown function [Cupriavidus taiwanensis]|nr:protein of unknown function [Cupriavidus taiwanensis]
MIVRITRVKVGHRQALIVQNPSTACAARGFCFFVAGSLAAAQFRQAAPEPPANVLQSPYRVRTQKSKLRLWERSGSASRHAGTPSRCLGSTASATESA